MVSKIFCDMCNKQVKEECYVDLGVYDSEGKFIEEDSTEFDLCRECFEQIKEQLWKKWESGRKNKKEK